VKCRHCSAELRLPLIDLGSAPPSNAYLTESNLSIPEKWFPLRVLVCEACWLAQSDDFAEREELFSPDYAYFSSFSSDWLAHAKNYVEIMAKNFDLNHTSHVVEIAANDGYLLQYVKACGIPCTGVEPTASTATAARAKGIPIIEDFFGVRLARDMVKRGMQADLIAANNVLAHVPDINDFSAGFAHLLKPKGVATFEFPHLMSLIQGAQFDTIYHEHFSYLALHAVSKIFDSSGLAIFDVEVLSTHGGSLRVYCERKDTAARRVTQRYLDMLKAEREAGVTRAEYYAGFQQKTNNIKNAFLSFLLKAQSEGKSVAAYGAAAKGNTLLNYAGVRPDLIEFVAERNPSKQGKFMPGSRIPIVAESHLTKVQPNYIIVLPWNLIPEIKSQLEYTKSWGARLVTVIPTVEFM
jgi:hypothetical protein